MSPKSRFWGTLRVCCAKVPKAEGVELIRREIESTDQSIDRLVYGLAEEEIITVYGKE